MQTDLYHKEFEKYFASEVIKSQIAQAVQMVKETKRIFFIGNGGSNSICSHMMEDYMKAGGKKTFAFSDPPLITCFANDYGYENAFQKWIEFNFEKGDMLIAISSSGESKNIINAAYQAKKLGGKIISLSGFSADNSLSKTGDINFVTPTRNYGIVECFHQVILHIILDKMVDYRGTDL